MHSVLFVIPEYSHGGTNKSLENLLALMDHSRYEVSIYCLYEDGGDYYKRLFAPYAVIAGNPARIVRPLFTIDQIMEHESKLYAPNERLSESLLKDIFASYYSIEKK